MPRKPRVPIPNNPGELIKLAGAVYAQDQKLGAASPLHVQEGPLTWAVSGPQVAEAATLQADIERRERELKDLYGRRQPYLNDFDKLVRRSRDLLLGAHAANPAKLGDYGYDVVTTPAAKPSDGKNGS